MNFAIDEFRRRSTNMFTRLMHNNMLLPIDLQVINYFFKYLFFYFLINLGLKLCVYFSISNQAPSLLFPVGNNGGPEFCRIKQINMKESLSDS